MGNIRKKERLILALKDLRAAMLQRARLGAIAPMTEEMADKICEDLVSFANYGFPESHAWSFALIAYATAWIKAHYPTEFLLGLLNAQPMGFYPISTLIHDARRHGVEVLPPCLKTGSWECTTCHPEPSPCHPKPSPCHPKPSPCHPERSEGSLDGQGSLASLGTTEPALRVGWKFVRGIGDTVVERLKAAHAVRPFDSIADVVKRAKLDRGESLALARAGAFGGWAEDRRHAAWEALRATGDVLP
jgi:error-prone DNA polymerase